jgi:hypothetical protein
MPVIGSRTNDDDDDDDSVLKDVKLLKVETWWKKALDRNIWGGSSRRPRSIKDCRARRRRNHKLCKRRFCLKCLHVHVPPSSMIFILLENSAFISVFLR